MATKTNFILKVQDAKLADVQKALKDANSLRQPCAIRWTSFTTPMDARR